jgi:hypothetical protein
LASAIWSFVFCGFAVTAVLPAHAADMGVPSRRPQSMTGPASISAAISAAVYSVSQNGASTGGFNFTNTGNVRPTGVIGGAQIGANYEFAPWVVGVEASWTDSAITGSTLIGCTGPCVNPPGSKPPAGTLIASDRFTSEPHWFAALTGRVGYAANDWLFYAKGGGALMHVTH